MKMFTKENMQLIGIALWILGAFASFMNINRFTYDKNEETTDERKQRLKHFKFFLLISLLGFILTAMNVSTT